MVESVNIQETLCDLQRKNSSSLQASRNSSISPFVLKCLRNCATAGEKDIQKIVTSKIAFGGLFFFKENAAQVIWWEGQCHMIYIAISLLHCHKIANNVFSKSVPWCNCELKLTLLYLALFQQHQKTNNSYSLLDINGRCFWAQSYFRYVGSLKKK